MKRSKRHHYVPQHLIRKFIANDARVHVFDIAEQRTYKQVPKNVFLRNRFNEFIFQDYRVSFEKSITQLENAYLPALRKVWSEKTLKNLTEEELGQILIFIAFQFLRTDDLRQRLEEMQIDLHDKIKKMANGRKLSPDISPLDENEIKRFSYQFLTNSLKSFARNLVSRHLFLIHSPKDAEFILGDSPVSLHNDNVYGNRTNLGWEAIGLQIYVPISPKMTIAVWCNGVFGEMDRKLEIEKDRAKTLEVMTGHISDSRKKVFETELAQELMNSRNKFDELRKKVIFNRSVIADHEQMRFYNSMQIIYARRIVVSQSGNFSLIKKILKLHPQL